ncbi:DUF4910 domain-containing protein [Candidatus Falkowbacteria bacterium]|nr:DUF4910 domain-containing protein [Candidatus Falkowbacteria bacterium]
MMEILKKINGLFVTPVSKGTDEQNKILTAELPFKVHQYQSGREYNGWTVPYSWEVLKAEIKKDGRLIYDGARHPLGVIGSSESFQGKIPLDELKKHLYYFENSPDDIVYHCDLYYKPQRKIWGFSLPYNLYKNLAEGEYEVDLETKHTPGTMKVLDYTHQGDSDKTIVFNAHNCHAAQLNDGPAGYVVFMAVMKRLKEKRTKYTYKLVIAPEHLGTVFYLADLKPEDIKKFKLGIFMEMVGHDNPNFSLQESFDGKSLVDKIAHHVLRFKNKNYWSDGFRQIIGNDESVWEAPGYEVPMISLSRCKSQAEPYPQYHLSSDNISIMCEDKLEETAAVIMSIIDILEKDCLLQRKFTGLIALSNPKYDLYIIPGNDPSIKEKENLENRKKWSNLMNDLPRCLDQNISILDISIKYDLPFAEVYDYLVKFKEKNLIDFIDKDFI